MDIRPIRTDDDHRLALREVERLWGAQEGTPEGDKLDVLATLIEAYENRYYPVPAADPVDILHFAIEDMGRSQAELAALLGSRARASEVLNRKRRLTVEMIAKIREAWRIPVEALAKACSLGTSKRTSG
jgi:HTH-type transcriptional regulator/antitoxin HigA